MKKGETAAQYTAGQKAVSKIWRAFRPCKYLFFTSRRLHSTQRAKKLHEKWREFHAHDYFFTASAAQRAADEKAAQKMPRVSSVQMAVFSQCVGRVVHSELESLIQKMARVPSM